MNHAMSTSCVLASILLCATVSAQSPQSAAAGTREGGIWKAAVPATPMQAEFGGLDPLGLAAGAQIKADCSLNWIDPDDGARYCFSSGTSLEFFLEHPKASIVNARRQWQKLRVSAPAAAE
jgi:hypothetical protein